MAEIHFCPIKTNPNASSIASEKFSRLTAIAPVSRGKDCAIKWLCGCECGGWAIVATRKLKSGKTRSCGCLKREMMTTHGHGRTEDMNPTFRSWLSMRSRCKHPATPGYEHYGGRGIKVCERWDSSFETFLADMGERPGRDYSIDRIDTDGDYCPENCRWATKATQNRNRRNNVLLTFDGETKCLKDWCDQYGITAQSYRYRIRKGWSPRKALTEPKRHKHGDHSAAT